MFNPSVGVRIFDEVLLKFAAFMPPPTLPLPRETSSSSSSSSSNNSPTISIGIASTKSLTSISGKRIDASSFAFIVVDIVMMSSSSPSFPLSLVSVFLRKAHSAFRSHKIERKNLSLILSLSLSLSLSYKNKSKREFYEKFLLYKYRLVGSPSLNSVSWFAPTRVCQSERECA